MTLQDLTKALESLSETAPLIFETQAGEINAGYHLTELKLSDVRSIDCGGRRTEWQEAALQLLDGYGGAHMQVGKFAKILKSSIHGLDGLGDVPAHVEFAHNNEGLQVYALGTPHEIDGRVLLPLKGQSAGCKVMTQPGPALASHQTDGACCGPASSAKSGCC